MERDQLLQIAPLMGVARADTFLNPLKASMALYGIDTVDRQAHYLAQILWESQNFGCLIENLNYKPSGILATFNTPTIKRFSEEDAERLGRTPEHAANQRAIALQAYNGRMGNRLESEDGYRYRGRGLIQLTGRANYEKCGKALGHDLVESPELAQQPDIASLAAAWYWNEGNPHCVSLNKFADKADVGAITRAINGGKHGLLERFNLTQRALGVLKGKP